MILTKELITKYIDKSSIKIAPLLDRFTGHNSAVQVLVYHGKIVGEITDTYFSLNLAYYDDKIVSYKMRYYDFGEDYGETPEVIHIIRKLGLIAFL